MGTEELLRQYLEQQRQSLIDQYAGQVGGAVEEGTKPALSKQASSIGSSVSSLAGGGPAGASAGIAPSGGPVAPAGGPVGASAMDNVAPPSSLQPDFRTALRQSIRGETEQGLKDTPDYSNLLRMFQYSPGM